MNAVNDSGRAQNYSSLMKDLEAGTLKPPYFFFGPEDVLVERALDKLKKVALESGSEDFNWNVFRADSDDFNDEAFADALNSLPLIPARRVVVLKQASGVLRQKGLAQLMESSIRQSPADLVLVLIEETPDFKKTFYQLLAQNCTCVSFPFPNYTELHQHLRSYAADFGKELADDTLERILTETNPSLRDLLSKLEVLLLYVGDKKTVEPQDMEECTAFTREVEIFKLLQALGKRNAAEARLTLEQLLQRRVEIGALISLLYRQIWALYRMKYLQEQKVPNWKWKEHLNIKPQFLEKRYRQYLPNYSRRELGRSLEILAQADKDRKSSAVQDDFILRTLTENLLEP